MKPFVKWAEGKTQILDRIKRLMPNTYNNYFEPFVGGGALLFELTPQNATINDKNSDLINVYKRLQEDSNSVKEVIDYINLRRVVGYNDKEIYNTIRDSFNESIGNANTFIDAAEFIWLNNHCHNGLFRVNKSGKFNVPYSGIPVSGYDDENLTSIGYFLKNVNILSGDFEESVKEAKEGDFVFFDPPYDKKYTKDSFTNEDQVRLSLLFKSLTNNGVKCMLTSHNTEFIRSLYSEFNIMPVKARRNKNSKSTGRKGEEIIITNY